MLEETGSLMGRLFAGRFVVLRSLGHGGMGEVYIAQHQVLERAIALKVVHRRLMPDEATARMFRREARAASRIDHANVTAIYDFGHAEPDGRPYIAMELVEGRTLRHALAEHGPLPLPRLLYILRQIAEAMAAAHAESVVHLDLKPENVMLTRNRGSDDFVKVTDFGLATILGEKGASAAEDGEPGQLFGTPAYMAPEQVSGGEVGRGADIYGFGVLAYECIVGDVPFDGTGAAVIFMHMHDDVPPLASRCDRNDIPPGLEQLVMRCLAKRPEDRFASFGDLLEALGEIERQVGGPPLSPKTTLPPTLLATYLARAATSHDTERIVRDKPTPPGPAESAAPADDADFSPLERTIASRHSSRLRWRNLDDLVLTLRERDLGDVRLSHLLAAKLRAEDQALALEAEVDMLHSELVHLETRVREREARLRLGLRHFESELARGEQRRTDAEGLPRIDTELRQLYGEAKVLAEALRNIRDRHESRHDAITAQIAARKQDIAEANDRLGDTRVALVDALRRIGTKLTPVLDDELRALFAASLIHIPRA